MIDPLQRVRRRSRVSQGYGSTSMRPGAARRCASERLRGLLAGIELADSVTIDAHKWFATTMGCGMFITRHPQVLSDAFRVSAEFMPSSVTQLDPYLNTVQWSRRFLGLRLFLSLGGAGWDGYARARGARRSSDRVAEGAPGRARLEHRQRLAAGGAVRDAAGRLRADPRHRAARAGLRARLGGGIEVRGTRGRSDLRDARGDCRRGRGRTRGARSNLGLDAPSKRASSASIEAIERKFSGVMSPCGMLRSNSPSTASIRFTILIELMPSSLRRASTGDGFATGGFAQDLADQGLQAAPHGRAVSTGFADTVVHESANDTGSRACAAERRARYDLEPVAVDRHGRGAPGIRKPRGDLRQRGIAPRDPGCGCASACALNWLELRAWPSARGSHAAGVG